MNRGTSGIAAILVTSVLWGTTGTAATFAPDAGPLAIGAAALGIGGLLQALIALPSLRRSRQALRAHAGLVTIGAVAITVYPLTNYGSMHLSGVAVGTVVQGAAAPLASGVLERFLEHRPVSRPWMLAASLGILGSTLLCLSQAGEPAAATATAAGVGLALVAGTTYAVYSWVVHRLMQHHVRRAASMGAVFGAGGALLIPVLLVTGAPLIASVQSVTVAAYMALVPMFLGYLLFGYGLTRVPPSTATTLTLTSSAVAAVLAVIVVDERLAITGWIGLSVISAALIVLTLAPPTSPAPRPAHAMKPASGYVTSLHRAAFPLRKAAPADQTTYGTQRRAPSYPPTSRTVSVTVGERAWVPSEAHQGC